MAEKLNAVRIFWYLFAIKAKFDGVFIKRWGWGVHILCIWTNRHCATGGVISNIHLMYLSV